MTLMLKNYARDQWFEAGSGLSDIISAVDGSVVARTGTDGLDFAAMLHHARDVGSVLIVAEI